MPYPLKSNSKTVCGFCRKNCNRLSGYRKRMLLCHNGLHLLHRKNNINVYNSKAACNEKMNSYSPFV